MSAAAVLDSMLDTVSRCLNVESAKRLIELKLSPDVQERIAHLAELCNEDKLTDEERDEYEALINAADFISILKMKARRQLLSTE